MRFSKELLLPRIKREKDPKLERFVVNQINKELANLQKNDEFYDLVQMQYFFLEMYKNKPRRDALLKRLSMMK